MLAKTLREQLEFLLENGDDVAEIDRKSPRQLVYLPQDLFKINLGARVACKGHVEGIERFKLPEFDHSVELGGEPVAGIFGAVTLLFPDQFGEIVGIGDQDIDNLLLVQDEGDLAGFFNAAANQIADDKNQFISDLRR